MKRVVPLAVIASLVLLTTPVWLPLPGTALAVEDQLQTADVALVLEGTGKDAPGAAEAWRREGLVHDVVIVEAPVKTHALVAYWSDFVRWGLADPAPTPPDHLRVVRAGSSQAGQQAQAALAAIQELKAATVLVLGGGGIGSRLVERDLASVFSPFDVRIRMVRHGEAGRDPGAWYRNAEDRRAVLDSWLQWAVPFLSGYDART